MPGRQRVGAAALVPAAALPERTCFGGNLPSGRTLIHFQAGLRAV